MNSPSNDQPLPAPSDASPESGLQLSQRASDALPDEPSLSDVVYHLPVLQAVGLVEGLADGRYRPAP